MHRLARIIDRLPDAWRRALRTGLQTFVGVVVLNVAAAVIAADSFVASWGEWLGRVDQAAVAGVAALVTAYSQNALEDRGKIPAVGKLTPLDRPR